MDSRPFPSKKCRRRLLSIGSNTTTRDNQDHISHLPDECVQIIFSHLPSRDRCTCAAVSKKWLLLLANMRGCEFKSHRSPHLDGIASRCLEAKDANDARVAAMAVGTYARKVLADLSLRGGVRITDFGVQIVSKSFPNLTSLSLWDCYKVSSTGLASIAKCCPKLKKLDISNSTKIDDDGLVPIAENCLKLSTLILDSCPQIGNGSLLAFAKCSNFLESISLTKCPLADDVGVIAVITGLPKLTKVRLAGLKIGDKVLEAIGKRRGVSIKMLCLGNIAGFSTTGISWIGATQKLEVLSFRSCNVVDVLEMERIKWSFFGLRHLDIKNCGYLTDTVLVRLVESTRQLETLKLKKCGLITSRGLVAALKNCSDTLKTLSLVRCEAIGIEEVHDPIDGSPPLLESLTLKKCYGVKDPFLTTMAPCCVRIRHIGLVDLPSITDIGLVTLLRETSVAREATAVRASFSRCVRLTDRSIMALAKVFGGRLRSLSLEGCVGLGDRSLDFIGELCTGLVELDISGCDVSDDGVTRLAMAEHQKLEVLSLAGCGRVTDESLLCLEMMCIGLVGLNLQRCEGVSTAGIDSLRSTLWWCDLLR